jgi:hypothetical protein
MRTFLMLGSAAVALVALVPTAASAAQPLYSRYLASETCYLKLYDANHMRRYPKQTLSKFHVVAMTPDPLKAKHPSEFNVRFGYWVKNAGYYDGQAKCVASGSGANCSVESDGGSFSLAPSFRKIKVSLGSRLQLEGAKGSSSNVATSDNRILLLPAAPRGSCAK